MKIEVFNKHVEEQIEKCRNVLIVKGAEYGAVDRLHNFQAFSDLAGVSLEQACGGFLGKHIVSIYDMIRETGEGKKNDLAKWDEKIGDALNYLLILSAIVRKDEPSSSKCDESSPNWQPICDKQTRALDPNRVFQFSDIMNSVNLSVDPSISLCPKDLMSGINKKLDECRVDHP